MPKITKVRLNVSKLCLEIRWRLFPDIVYMGHWIRIYYRRTVTFFVCTTTPFQGPLPNEHLRLLSKPHQYY